MNVHINNFNMNNPLFNEGFQFGPYTITALDFDEMMYELDNAVWVNELWIVNWLNTPRIKYEFKQEDAA